MKKIITTIAMAVAINACNLFAASDYVIRITENDGRVRDIPVSSLDKVTFEAQPQELTTNQKIVEKLKDEKIYATQYKMNARKAEKMVQRYHAKGKNF